MKPPFRIMKRMMKCHCTRGAGGERERGREGEREGGRERDRQTDRDREEGRRERARERGATARRLVICQFWDISARRRTSQNRISISGKEKRGDPRPPTAQVPQVPPSYPKLPPSYRPVTPATAQLPPSYPSYRPVTPATAQLPQLPPSCRPATPATAQLRPGRRQR